MLNITILGSTGSIGVSTLDVVERQPELYRIFALVAGQNTRLLADQILKFRPKMAVVAADDLLPKLIDSLVDLGIPQSEWPQLDSGSKARVAAATDPEVDFVLSAIVGVSGLEATYEAVRLGKRVGLANKEVLVASGKLVMEAARQSKTELIPVDSEHNGVHQCLRSGRNDEVSKLILTASGGPFRETPADLFSAVTPAQALKHPTWKMGQRITIDSATMMNKGFEVIEACWLFDFPWEKVDVVVHPQSCVHAMVEFTDGSVIAQLSATDMRMPIQYALSYPARQPSPVPRLDWSQARSWQFYPPDPVKFRALGLAYEALRAGGSAGCTLNAADEIAVEAFLNEQISFPDIAVIIEKTLNRVPNREFGLLEDVLEVDRESREVARQIVPHRPCATGRPV